jgi:SAM-dependent methyltransferase
MILSDLPFYIGPSKTPFNPSGIPNSYPFELYIDNSIGIIRQKHNSDLLNILKNVYELGMLIGTPLSDEAHAKPYADDFVDFIEYNLKNNDSTGPLRILEIGAGTGYLSHRLALMGHNVTALEPGIGYKSFWDKYQVKVINKSFPSSDIGSDYDVIVSYLVLEHILDPKKFLDEIRKVLRPNGFLFLAVPDEQDEIKSGDPSMLVHEHFSYYDNQSLSYQLMEAGFSANVVKSNFGRCLYSVSQHNSNSQCFEMPIDLKTLEHYEEVLISNILKFRENIGKLYEKGSVGIFCPSRALAFLNIDDKVRFFDDDPTLTGKYYAPFNIPIENRESLISHPVHTLVIMSRTFGAVILNSLASSGYKGHVNLIDEIF